MSTYIATVIKTGNSYALRVPKSYIDDNKLQQGQKVYVDSATTVKKYDPKKVEESLRKLQELNPYRDVKDPIAWQRESRSERPIPGREY